jgi:hypothetical protein
MEIKDYKQKVFNKYCILRLASFSNQDRKKWKTLFNSWKKLKFGMRDFKSREPNFPEGLSEVAFCLFSGSKRFISLSGSVSASFDTFNIKTGKTEQIKACSVGSDLTSFGPQSKWDDLYFLDFYNNGKLDGTFNIYKIPNNLIYNMEVNKNQTMKQQQAQGRRPRFSITDKIIKEYNIKPLKKDVKVW